MFMSVDTKNATSNIFGELKGTSEHKQIVKSPMIRIGKTLSIDLVHNDVPVTVFYRHGNYPWKSILINSVFSEEAIPRFSDLYLSCFVNNTERVIFDIRF